MSRTNRVYCEQSLRVGREFTVSGETHHYLSRVLRVRSKGEVYFFNHEGREFLCNPISIDRRSSIFVCKHEVDAPAEPAVVTRLYLAVSKNESMDFSLQKATELGVSVVQPLLTTHSVRSGDRLDHWRAVVRSACEQCGRVRLPEVREPVTIDQMGKIPGRVAAFVLDLQSDGILDVQSAYSAMPEGVHIAVGPEGDWRDDEVAMLNELGFKSVYLGARVLRCDTAVVVALGIAQHQIGALK